MVPPALPQGLRTRIAPTPSGLLHAGNGASFVLTWKLARAAQGTVLLRIDDLDAERVRPAYVEDIFRTLKVLGIEPDEGPHDPQELARSWSQQLRMDRYRTLLDRLRERMAVYACTCTRSMADGCTCRAKGLDLDAADVSWKLDLLNAAPVVVRSWPGSDLSLRPADLMPDPVVRQRNGRPAYQIASLADDQAFGIDFVVRGEDLLPSTVCQLHLARSLGEEAFSRIHFVHHRLLTDAQGMKLSKSQGAGSLQDMLNDGMPPEAIRQLADELLADLLRNAADQA